MPWTVIRGPGQSYAAHKKRSWFTRSMTVCPPSVLAPTSSASAVGPRETLQSAAGATAGARSFFVSSAQAVRVVGQPPPASEAWSRAPATNPRRFAHRTTDMAPMLRHADPCRASPCRPRCLLPASGRASPRSRALSSPGAKAAEAVPTPGMLSFESSSSFALLLGDLLVQTLFHAPGRRRQQRSFLTLAAPCGAAMPNSATAKRRPLPPGCAPAASFPAVPRSSRRRTSGGTRLRRPRPPRRSRLTKGLTQTGGNNLTSWPGFSRSR